MEMTLGQRKEQDVAVIGASAAGLFTAYLLARGGVRVRVFEGADRLEPTPRTLIVTHQLCDVLGSLSEDAVVNEIHRFELVADGQIATVSLCQPDLVVERTLLMRSLARYALAAGAEIIRGRWFRSLVPTEKNLTLLLERGRRGGDREVVQASTVVGADGAFSKVGKAAGWPQQPTVSLVQAIVPLPIDLPKDTTRVWFVPEDTPYFYWLIPESPTRGVLGLIGESGQKTRQCLERFLDKQGLTPLAFQGARIPLYTRWIPVHRQLSGGDVYLVGDAAGQVKVSTVGGLVTGFRGALGVAETILQDGADYELRALRREMDRHLFIRRVLHHFTLTDYARLLMLLHTPAKRSLSTHSRDEAGKLLWRLCLTQPRLLLLGLRALLGGTSFPPSPQAEYNLVADKLEEY